MSTVKSSLLKGLGESYLTSSLRKQQRWKISEYREVLLGRLVLWESFRLDDNDYNYGYNSVLQLDDGLITNRLKGNLVQAGASYQKKYRRYFFGKEA